MLSGLLTQQRALIFFNVKDFGAVGNGTADDTTAIQAAINAAGINGGTVFFPAGTYKTTSTLSLPSLVSLRGIANAPSTGGSTIKFTGTTTDAVQVLYSGSANTAISIEKLRIEGPGTGTGNGIHIKNTGTNPFISMAFRDVYIAAFGGYGFVAECLIVSVLENVVCESNLTGGFFLNGALSGAWSTVNTSVTFISCYANGNGTYGYNIDHSTYIAFIGCASDSNGINYSLNTCNSVSFSGCGSEYGNPDAASPGVSWKITGSNQVTLTGCYAYQTKAQSMWVTGTSLGIVLIGFEENSNIGTTGLQIDTGSHATSIGCVYNATVSGAARHTVLDDGSGNGTISGNLTIAGSILNSGNALQFAGDSLADLYRVSSGVLATDGGLTVFGNVTTGGIISLKQSASAASLASSGTIAVPGLSISRVTTSAAVTGVILASGTVNGQIVTVINESANSITFAASGTSHVADGTSDVIAATSARSFVWNGSLWYPCK
jgi:hypothetical protein